jgi:hypothetical protein
MRRASVKQCETRSKSAHSEVQRHPSPSLTKR